MRNPEVPLRTTLAFRENGFNVEAFAIAAPALFTELGFYLRYQEEKDFQGYGRLADKNSHDRAVEGLLHSLDHLYNEKAVDKIHLYNYQAENHLVTFSLSKQQWDINILPSTEVIKARREQIQDNTLCLQLIARAYSAIPRMSPPIKTIVEALIEQLKD